MKKYNSTSSSPLKNGLGVLRLKPLCEFNNEVKLRKKFVLTPEARERIAKDMTNIQRIDNQIKRKK